MDAAPELDTWGRGCLGSCAEEREKALLEGHRASHQVSAARSQRMCVGPADLLKPKHLTDQLLGHRCVRFLVCGNLKPQDK